MKWHFYTQCSIQTKTKGWISYNYWNLLNVLILTIINEKSHKLCLILDITLIGRTVFSYLVHYDCTPSSIRLFCEELSKFELIIAKEFKERNCTASKNAKLWSRTHSWKPYGQNKKCIRVSSVVIHPLCAEAKFHPSRSQNLCKTPNS